MRAEIILSSNWMKKIQLHLGFHAKIGFPKNFGPILTGKKNFENRIFWKFLLYPTNSYLLIFLNTEMKITQRIDNHNLIQGQMADHQSLGGIILSPLA